MIRVIIVSIFWWITLWLVLFVFAAIGAALVPVARYEWYGHNVFPWIIFGGLPVLLLVSIVATRRGSLPLSTGLPRAPGTPLPFATRALVGVIIIFFAIGTWSMLDHGIRTGDFGALLGGGGMFAAGLSIFWRLLIGGGSGAQVDALEEELRRGDAQKRDRSARR